MSAPSVLVDIDGTLVDTNYLHVLAWRRAFLEEGHDVAAARIHRRIGAGADVLMGELIGDSDSSVKAAWRRHFDALKPEIRAFPRAGDLLRAFCDRGLTVVLASSAEPDDTEALLAAIDADDAISAVVHAGDVETAKPEPDVFVAAMEKAGASTESALALGDTVWDVEAAGRCGLRCVGVLTGGVSRQELMDAGALEVHPDAAKLLEGLDGSAFSRLVPARA